MTDTDSSARPSSPPAIIQSVTVGVEADGGVIGGVEYAVAMAFDSRPGAGTFEGVLTDYSMGIGLVNGFSLGFKMGFWTVPPDQLTGEFFSISTEVDPKYLVGAFGSAIPPGSRFALGSVGKTWYFNLRTGKFIGVELSLGGGHAIIPTWPNIDLRVSIGTTNNLTNGDLPAPFPRQRVFQRRPPPESSTSNDDDDGSEETATSSPAGDNT